MCKTQTIQLQSHISCVGKVVGMLSANSEPASSPALSLHVLLAPDINLL